MDEATWEDEELLKYNFPEFCNHEDMVIQGGGVVRMASITV